MEHNKEGSRHKMRTTNYKLSILISLIVVISLSTTYAYIQLTDSGNTATGEAGCFVVNYDGQAINNASLQSTTNYTESDAFSTITLSKNENCEIYTEASIYIHTNSATTDAPLSDGAMKYKIFQGSTEIATGTIVAVTADSEDQLLKKVTLTEDPITYTIYIWIDTRISQGSYNGKNYSGYLYARSTQSSTVTQ